MEQELHILEAKCENETHKRVELTEDLDVLRQELKNTSAEMNREDKKNEHC